MNIVIVYNPRSGSARSKGELQTLCRQNGLKVRDFIAVRAGWHKKLAPFIKKGATIAVVGGDGTISSTVQLIQHTKAVLAPLPGGTLNHFTKDLGVVQELPRALAHLKNATIHTVDVATVNGQTFINNSSLGLYPSALQGREQLEKYLGKWIAVILASLKALLTFRTYHVTIGRETFKTPFVFVGNNIYQLNGVEGVSRTHLTQGVLSVFIAKTTSRYGFLLILGAALFKKARLLDSFEVRHSQAMTVATKRHYVTISRDGEIAHIASPLRYEIQPGKLRVLY